MVNVKRNQYTVTQQRKAPESGKKSELPKHSRQQTRATPAGRTAEATSFPTKSENDRITVVVGDSIIKNLQGRKLAKTVGHRVVVKPFPGTTIHDMKSHIIATVEKCPDQTKAFKKGVLYHAEDCNRGPKNDPPILEPAFLLVNR